MAALLLRLTFDSAGEAKSIKNCRIVQQALPSLAWVQDIKGNMSPAGILEFFKLLDSRLRFGVLPV